MKQAARLSKLATLIVGSAEGAGITILQLRMIAAALEAPGKLDRPGALAQLFCVSHPAISRAADGLVRLNLIDRVEVKNDRRTISLCPTDRGVELVRAIDAEYRSLNRKHAGE